MSIAGVFVISLLVVTMVLPTYANNIQVGKPILSGQNATEGYTHVQFDLSWDNSWKTNSAPNNWDAAWVFVKYQKTDTSEWKHATLNIVGHSVNNDNGVVAEIMIPPDGRGAFLYRADGGMSNINWDGVRLCWNYRTDELENSDLVTVKVFAIEMVYIPQGAFDLGDAVKDNLARAFYQVGTDGPYQIMNEGAINIASTSGNLWATGHIEADTLPAEFPKGYAAFYCMKYEISQEQYADFLNTLTTTQDAERFPNQNGINRHTITGSSGSRSASVPDRACNFLNWADGCAYADWAGLRPMTELEFEKSCRGIQAAINDEFAWGNKNIYTSVYVLSNNGQPNETVSNPAIDPTGNASYTTTGGSIGGPLRCGIFAMDSSTRAVAGASYYGVMEMSGNLQERAVTVANSAGRGFTGYHGDGSLGINGDANVSNWPGTDALGAGFRGGHWGDRWGYLCVANRFFAGSTDNSRRDDTGFRGVRTAP
jgi:formylglycine-generating enzyme required for sulfatase activity